MNDRPTDQQVFTQLRDLAGQAGEALYRRVVMARDLLHSRAWVESPEGGGGSLNEAHRRLEGTCFPEFVGHFTMSNLLELLDAYPDLKQWRAHGFQYVKMLAIHRAKVAPRPARTQPTPAQAPYTPPLAFNDEPPGRQRRDYERLYRAVDAKSAEAARLRARLEVTRPVDPDAKDQEIERLRDVLAAVTGELDAARTRLAQKDAEIARLRDQLREALAKINAPQRKLA